MIVVDDGPDTATRHLVEHRAREGRTIGYVATPGGVGPAAARNIGVAVATGDVVLFCDDDDEVAPGWARAIFEALSSVDLVGGALEFDTLNSPESLAWRGVEHSDRAGRTGPGGPYAAGCNMGVRRAAFEAVGGFDDTIGNCGEDQDFCWRVLHAGFRYAPVPAAIVHYRARDTLGGAVRQAFGNGVATFEVDRRWGGAPVTWRRFLARWWWVISHVHWLARGSTMRGRWMVLTARTCGRLVAGVRARSLYA